MNPKPFSLLKNFTVPVAMCGLTFRLEAPIGLR
jgi:hypothetical protein